MSFTRDIRQKAAIFKRGFGSTGLSLIDIDCERVLIIGLDAPLSTRANCIAEKWLKPNSLLSNEFCLRLQAELENLLDFKNEEQ